MTLGTVTIGQARKDGRTIFSLSAMGSASLLPWRARQADHPRTIAKTRAANIAASSATKGCKEGVAACQRWFQRVERKWVIIRGDVNHGPTGQLAELWRLRPSAGRSIGRPLRCGVFHIAPPRPRPRPWRQGSCRRPRYKAYFTLERSRPINFNITLHYTHRTTTRSSEKEALQAANMLTLEPFYLHNPQPLAKAR